MKSLKLVCKKEIVLAIAFFSLFWTINSAAATDETGFVSYDTVWTAANSPYIMKSNPTINWTLFVTFLAVISAWLIPFALDCCRNKKRRKAIEASVALYLDSLEIKLNIAINRYFKLCKVVPVEGNSFETQNKANYDAIENFSRSEYLKDKEREELMELIRYFKISPTMEKEDFKIFLKKIKKCSLRKYFPRTPDLCSKIDKAIKIDESRLKR